jgi:hypothetical protein
MGDLIGHNSAPALSKHRLSGADLYCLYSQSSLLYATYAIFLLATNYGSLSLFCQRLIFSFPAPRYYTLVSGF